MKNINIDILLMFLFYVVGDTISTHYAIQSGGSESSTIPAVILSFEYGIYLLFIVKSLFILWVWYCRTKLITNYKFAWNIIKITVIGYGIITTVSNTYLIVTGDNLLPMCAAIF